MWSAWRICTLPVKSEFLVLENDSNRWHLLTIDTDLSPSPSTGRFSEHTCEVRTFLSPKPGQLFHLKQHYCSLLKELVCTRTIPTEWLLLIGEVSANFCKQRVSCGQRNRSLQLYSRLSRLEPLLFLSCSSSILLMRLSRLWCHWNWQSIGEYQRSSESDEKTEWLWSFPSLTFENIMMWLRNINIIVTWQRVTTDGVWIRNWIYWTLKQLLTTFYKSLLKKTH
jgi:hypothetical protein